MSNQKKNTKKPRVVTSEVGNYEKHPFFVRKAAHASEILHKSGLPPAIVKSDKQFISKKAKG